MSKRVDIGAPVRWACEAHLYSSSATLFGHWKVAVASKSADQDFSGEAEAHKLGSEDE